jgi:hypothetical protein
MQLECSDESLACSVGLQSTPSTAIRATVEGREILSAANGSAAVEECGDICMITTWAASESEVSAGSAWRLAHADGRCQLRWQLLDCSDCARGPAFGRVLAHVVSGIERGARNGLRRTRRRADRGAGIANT